MRASRVVVIAVIVAVILSAVYFGHLIPSASGQASSSNTAPNFTLTDIYGHPFDLANFTDHQVVVIEFTALSCSACQIVKQQLQTLYSGYNASGDSRVQIISIYIEPQFGDTIPALKTYHADNNITWTMAQDTMSLAVSQSYGVKDIPTVVIVDLHRDVVFDVDGIPNTGQMQSTITAALSGTAQTLSIVTVSVFALAAVAGVSTFFSPCAFPMFPGYMGLFLGLNANQSATAAANRSTYKGAARRAVAAGSVTALGMILVFSILGVALIAAASVISGYIPYLLIAVGAVLIALGGLLLTNLQYWKVVKPFQELWYRVGGKRPEETLSSPTAPSGRALYVKLFSYGMGYAAAAAGCVAPVIFSAIFAGLALGLFGGIVNVLIFSATAAALMIVVTVVLALAGNKYVQQLKALTPTIKKVSAAALIVVGIYLVWFYYQAWGF